MNKLGHLLIGDNSTLNDAMVGSTEGRAILNREYIRENWNDKVGKVFSCDVDHMYASVSDTQSKDRVINHLKEVLLIHLDLVQHQSEVILSRDREISALREERDTLRSRFQRLERRVTLQRQKDDLSPIPGPSPPAEDGALPSIPLRVQTASSLPASPAAPETVSKRRRVSTSSGPRRKRRTVSGGSDRTKRSCSASDSMDADRRSYLRVPLTSDTVYFTATGDGKDVWTADDLRINTDAPRDEDMVQVPSWREKVLSPLYVIEGTENLEDEVFLKRHQKHESDERRRKRWDIQRIREQTHVEKLKQRELKGRGKGSTVNVPSPERHVYSFFPALEDVQEVSVNPNLPVVAFGLPLRLFDDSEFSLSWSPQTGPKFINLRQR